MLWSTIVREHYDLPLASKISYVSVEIGDITAVLDEAAVGNKVLGAVCNPAIAVEYYVPRTLLCEGLS